MSDAGRLLQLLSLLQTPRAWSGPELSARLAVSARTIRRDVERLRDLGYPVETNLGVTGGYRLRAGTAMPPLLLDDEEAVALAVGLGVTAGRPVAGIEDASLRALTKLEQVLPARLRHRVRALEAATATLWPSPAGPAAVDSETLASVAVAVVNQERLRFHYEAASGVASRRFVEPYRLVAAGQRWYLVAFDLDRQDWRLFRLDRLDRPEPGGLRFTPRPLPAADAPAFVAARLMNLRPVYTAEVTLALPEATAAARFGARDVTLTPLSETTCRARLSAETLDSLIIRLLWLDCAFTIHAPPELVTAAAELAERWRAAASAGENGPTQSDGIRELAADQPTPARH